MRVLEGSIDGVANFNVASGANAAISDVEAKDRSPKRGVSIATKRRQLLSNRKIGRRFKLTDSFDALRFSGECFSIEDDDASLGESEGPGRRRNRAQFRVN